MHHPNMISNNTVQNMVRHVNGKKKFKFATQFRPKLCIVSDSWAFKWIIYTLALLNTFYPVLKILLDQDTCTFNGNK